jgi:hypothetical protein
MAFVDTVKKLSPPWLLTGTAGSYMQALAQGNDEIAGPGGRLSQAIKLRMPGIGDPSALPYIGADRLLPRASSESDASYAARLQTAFETWQLAGTRRALMSQCLIYINGQIAHPVAQMPLSTIVSQDSAGLYGTWDTYYSTSDLTQPPAHNRVAPTNWNWDGVDHWWRAWLTFYVQAGSSLGPENTWGDGTWGQSGGSWGFNVEQPFFDGLRSILLLWKSANTFYPWVQWCLTPNDSTAGSEISPLSSPGSGNPNGTWGRWGTVIGGVYSASRPQDMRFSDGSVTVRATQLSPAFIPVPSGSDETMLLITDVNLSIGDWVVASTGSGHVTKALAANLPAAGMALGVATTPGIAGFVVNIQVTGLVPSSVTGFSGNGLAKVNPATGRAELTATIGPTDYPLGTVNNGHITMGTIPPKGSNISAGLAKYNLDPTGAAFSDVGLQSSINDAAISPASSIGLNYAAYAWEAPEGLFRLNAPLHISVSGGAYKGSSHAATNIVMNSSVGPAIYCSPVTTPVPVAANDFAGGNAYIMTPAASPADQQWMEVSEYGAAFALNNAPAFGVEMIIKRTAADTADGVLLMSSGSRASTDPQFGCFQILLTGSANATPNAIIFALNVNGSGYGNFGPTAANVIPFDGLYHEVACFFSSTSIGAPGKTVWIFVDKVLQYSINWPGTLIQNSWEYVLLGRGAAQFYGMAQVDTVPHVNLASIRVSDTVRYTTSSSLTLPTAKYPNNIATPNADPHTLFSCNFDDFNGIFTKAVIRGDSGVGTNYVGYVPNRHDNPGLAYVSDTKLERMSVLSAFGPAIDVAQGNNFEAEKLRINGSLSGIRLLDNCYNSSIHDCIIVAGGNNRRVGVQIGNASYYTNLYDCLIQGFVHGLVTTSDTTLAGFVYIIANANQWVSINPININAHGNIVVSDEASPGTLKNLLLINTASAVLSGIQIGCTGTALPAIEVDGQSGFTNETRVKTQGCFFGLNSGSPGVWRLSPSSGVVGSVIQEDCPVNPTPFGTIPVFTSSSVLHNMSFVVSPQNEIGYVTQSIASLTAYTITNEQWVNAMVVFTGVLTGNCVLTAPAQANGAHTIVNQTTGVFTLTIKAAGSSATPITCAAGHTQVQSNGTDLVQIA